MNASPAPQLEDDHDNSSIVLTINVLNAKNIKGSKPALNSFVRVQFADFDYKDTPIITESSNPEYGLVFEQTFQVDENLIEIFANKLINFTLFESLPKEKTAALGTAELSLYSRYLNYYKLAEAESTVPDCPLSFQCSLPIQYANSKILAPNQDQPVVNLKITLSRPLITAAQLQSGAFATVYVEDLYPVPEDWSLREGNEKDLASNLYCYNLSLTLPSDKGERIVTIPNGMLISADGPIETDPLSTVPQGILTECAKEQELKVQNEMHNNSEEQTANANEKAEKEFKIVRWGVSQIIWLNSTAVKKLQDMGQKRHLLELEFTRSVQAKFSNVTDTTANKWRAKSHIDIGLALFPNISGIRGRFGLESTEVPVETTPVDPKSKKGGTVDVYKSIGTALSLKIYFSVPLMSRKTLSELTKTVNDYIPRLSLSPEKLFTKNSQQAENQFRHKITDIVQQLVNEYQESLSKEQKSPEPVRQGRLQSQNAIEEESRKKLFMFHLNKSGAYFTIKEELKAAVVQVIREKFNKKSPFTDKKELSLFLSETYIYLVGQMHFVINNVYSEVEEVEKGSKAMAELAALKEFAETAEWNRQIDVAAKYYKERIARYEDDYNAWFDYAAFCLRDQQIDLGQEGFKDIIRRNPKHTNALMGHALNCITAEAYDEARVFLEAALANNPESVLINSLIGLYFDIIGEDYESEQYFNKAKELAQKLENCRPFLDAATFAVQVNCSVVADKALAQDLILNGLDFKPYLLLSKLEVQRNDFTKAYEVLKDALKLHGKSPSVWAEIGNLHYIQGRLDDAKVAYETVLSFAENKPNLELPLDSIYVRLGNIYLAMVSKETVPESASINAKIAKTMFTKACAARPSSKSWLGLGRACFTLKEYAEAEDAFSEANILNNKDSEVWAHLALLNLYLNRTVEANQAIAQALRMGIKDPDILKQVGMAFCKEKQPAAAVELFKLALETSPQDKDLQDGFAKALDQVATLARPMSTEPLASS